MANPIKKDELVTQEAITQVNDLIESMNKLVASLAAFRGATAQQAQETAKNATATQESVEAYAKASAQIAAMEKALIEERKVTEQLTADIKKLKEEKVKYGKATEDEKANVKSLYEEYKALAGEMRNGNTVTKDRIREIELEKKSYNELYATYNAVKSVLNGMTTAERENTDAGKAMVAQALQIRDKLNELQKSTGNYTLQVGKYRAAFDGLGYSFQQILREAPSALNINQFFLAISNNIPQFLDQLKAFNAEQAEIKSNLDTMTKGTKEYAEQLSKVESVGKKLGRTLMSWQTLVLVGLMIIRNWERIVSGISNLFSNLTREAKALMNVNQGAASTVGELTAKYKALQKEWNNLKEQDKGEWIKQHQNDWNELGISINNATDAENLYVKNTSTVQNAIDARARSIAAMKIASEKYEEAFRKQAKAEQDLASGKMGFWRSAALSLASAGMAEGTGTLNQEQQSWQEGATKKSIQSYYEQQMKAVKKLQEEAQYYITTWVLPDPLNQKKGSGSSRDKQFDFSPSDVDDEYWKAEQARIRMMEKGYDMEIDLQRVKHEEMLEQNDVWQGKREEQLMDNLMGELTLLTNGNEKAAEQMFNAIVKNDTEAVQQMSAGAQQLAQKYWSDVEEGQRQHDLIMQGLIIDNNEAIKAINQKYDKQQMDAIQEQYKSEMRVVARRNKTIVQEQQKNADLAYNINVLRQEMEALTTAQYKDNDSKEEAAQRAAALSKEIEKLQKQIDHTKQLSNYSSVGDIFRRNVGVGAGTQQSLMESILGKDAYSAFAPGSKEMEEAIEKDFDTWMQSAEKSLSTWYSTTMGYINDLISAYVELANAKAEAAAEATEAAQEEYDKEKALLEAGYASRVEATWAEYQEKKAAQEKAEADAKAAAQAQKELNEISTAGNMIVAASNIWKTFSALGPVGIAAAVAAIGTMFTAFVAAKVKASEVSQYGEGGFEVLEGGSHASGHDIDLGVRNRRGRRMRAEGKEGLGIFSRRAMNHYGANNIEAMVNSVNRLEFEGNAAKRMSLERSVGMAVLSAPRTDLHNVESDLHKLVSYGSRSRTVNADGSVTEIRKNARIVYKNI